MNIYLIASESIRQLDDKINKIINKDDAIITYDYNSSSMEEIINEAGYFSLFDDKKTIIVKNSSIFGSDKINETDTNLLINYLMNPNENTTIIFTLIGKTDGKKKIVKAIKEKFQYIEIEKYNINDLTIKIREIVKKDGYTIDNESIDYIINSCLGNYDLIYNEVEKIKLYYNEPCKFNIEEVKKITSKAIEDNNFKFIDAVINKDIKKIYKYIDDFEIIKVEPIALINLLAREYRLTYIAKTLYDEKKAINTIARELKLQNWQVDKILKNTFRFTYEDLEENLLILNECDLQLKKVYFDKYSILKAYILKLLEK